MYAVQAGANIYYQVEQVSTFEKNFVQFNRIDFTSEDEESVRMA